MARTKSNQAGSSSIVLAPVDWLEERSGLVGAIKYFLFRKVPHDTNWFQRSAQRR